MDWIDYKGGNRLKEGGRLWREGQKTGWEIVGMEVAVRELEEKGTCHIIP